MTRPNIFKTSFEYDDDDPGGYRAASAEIGRQAGGAELAVRQFELAAGNALCPYHYEYVEEWLIVLSGEIELRTPFGTESLKAGDVVCFPPGPDGAHKTTNSGAEPARILMMSSTSTPSVAVYPDSDKVGVWTENKRDDFMFRRADAAVDYYDGEA